MWQRVRKLTGPITDPVFVLACLATVGVTMVAVFKSLTLLSLPPVFKALSTIEHVSMYQYYRREKLWYLL